jgi:flagellar basal-body rod protein FlgG
VKVLRGAYAAASGMVHHDQWQAAKANNLANASTPGFKREVVCGLSFSQALAGARGEVIGRAGTGLATAESYIDLSPGPIVETGLELDFAIEGPGFFSVETTAGVRYTRAGNFKMDAEGYLLTAGGRRVLGYDGPVRLPQGTVRIEALEDGSIKFIEADGDETTTGRFLIQSPAGPGALVKVGEGLFEATGPDAMVEAGAECRVIQYSLEQSNVNVVTEMVEMLAGYRVFEAAQRAILAQDACLEKAVNEVGRVM